MRSAFIFSLLALLAFGCGARTGLDLDALVEQPDAQTPPRPDAGSDAGPDGGRDAGSVVRPDAAVPPNLEAAIQVSSGLWHSCAATQIGRVHCWGFNNRGQIGDGTGGPARLPVVSVGVSTARAIATGQSHSCAALEDGSALCWGANDSGQLGAGGESVREVVPTPVMGARDIVQVSAGGGHTCGLARDGRVLCWGLYDGVGSEVPDTFPRATPVPLDAPAMSVAAGLHHSCALLTSGDVVCWAGYQLDEGQVALPPGRNMHSVVLPGVGVEVSAGDEGSCAALASGEVWCWGFEALADSGAIAIETPTAPRAVPGLRDAVAVTSGHEFSCALLRDRSVRCWGNNERGQLGDGGLEQGEGALVTPRGLPPVRGVSAGWRHACALADDGAVWCWGRDWENQLGDGAGGESRLPTVAIVVRD